MIARIKWCESPGMVRQGHPLFTTARQIARVTPRMSRGHRLGGQFETAQNGASQVAVNHTLQVGQRDVEAVVVFRPAATADAGARRADVAAGAANQNVDSLPALVNLGGDPPDFFLLSHV